jgi:hypothetical protein
MAKSILSSLTDLFSAFASEEEKKQEVAKKTGVPPVMAPEAPVPASVSLDQGGTVPQMGTIPKPGATPMPPAPVTRQMDQSIETPDIPMSDGIYVPPPVRALTPNLPKRGDQGVPTFLNPETAQGVPTEPKLEVPSFGIDPTDIRSMEGMGTKPKEIVSASPADYKVPPNKDFGTDIYNRIYTDQAKGSNTGFENLTAKANQGVVQDNYFNTTAARITAENSMQPGFLQFFTRTGDEKAVDSAREKLADWITDKAPDYFKGKPEEFVQFNKDPQSWTANHLNMVVPDRPYGDDYVPPLEEPAIGNVASPPIGSNQATPPPLDGVPEKPIDNLQKTSQVFGQGTQALEANDVITNLPVVNDEDVDEEGKIKEDSPWYKTVFSNIGNYLGDAFSSTMNDPVVKRALVSYLASRAVGSTVAGSATFAGEVLRDGWKQQAALQEATNKARSTAASKTAENQQIDRTKIHTLFNSKDNSQLNGYYSRDSTIFEPSDPEAFAKAYGIKPDDAGNYPLQYSSSGLTQLGLRPKTSEDLTRKDQLNLVVENVKEETTNKLNYFTQGLESRGYKPGSEEYNQALAAHRKLLGEDGIRRALTTYAERLPTSVDISDPRVSTAFNQAIVDFEEAIASGRAVGNADLVGLIEQRFITHDLATQNIPAPAIRVTDELGQPLAEDAGIVGSNSWSRTNRQLDNLMLTAKQINKDNVTRKPTLYAGLSQVFNTSLTPEERAYWYKQSEISGEDKQDAASPLMLWLNASMASSSSNNDKAMGAMTPQTLISSLFN